jgi:hypothetical protein
VSEPVDARQNLLVSESVNAGQNLTIQIVYFVFRIVNIYNTYIYIKLSGYFQIGTVLRRIFFLCFSRVFRRGSRRERESHEGELRAFLRHDPPMLFRRRYHRVPLPCWHFAASHGAEGQQCSPAPKHLFPGSGQASVFLAGVCSPWAGWCGGLPDSSDPAQFPPRFSCRWHWRGAQDRCPARGHPLGAVLSFFVLSPVFCWGIGL